MKQNYDLPKIERRRSLQMLFREESAEDSNRADFVPFNKERDKLGHLISKKNQHGISDGGLRRGRRQSKSNRLIDPQKLSARTQKSDKTVMKIFKLKEIDNFRSAKQLPRLNLISPVFAANLQFPPEFVQKSGLRKHHSLKNDSPQGEVTIDRQNKPKPIFKQKRSSQPMNSVSLSRDESGVTHQPKKQNEKPKAEQINYNLPELQKYFASKKLKVKVFDNFEKSHLRFKELAKQGTQLNLQIRDFLDLY